MPQFLQRRWTIISCILAAGWGVAADGPTPVASIASQYSLVTSTTLSFPSETLSSTDASDFIVKDWSLSKGHLQNGEQDIQFVSDPFPNNQVPVDNVTSSSSTSVLEVKYPAGSYNNQTGGAQFYSLWNSTSAFQSMLLTYEISFDSSFDWVKGGKLPGIRGGPSVTGCSGGKEPNGTDCFSTRLMWRKDGQGEVYAYIPDSDSVCKDPNVDCNDDYGVSIQRGAFSFAAGQWNRISLLVQLNDPPSISNGYIAMYFNDIIAIRQTGVQFRTIGEVTAGGFFFSTFFGGNDASWATPMDTFTYFRNVELWGSSQGSTMSSAVRVNILNATIFAFCVAVIVFVSSELA